MAHKKYSITFTETTHRLICSLEKYGHNVRDIINAGIVLFDESDNPTRAHAHMRAYSNIPEEVGSLEKRLAAAKAERDRIIVKPPDGSFEAIEEKLGPNKSRSKKRKIS